MTLALTLPPAAAARPAVPLSVIIPTCNPDLAVIRATLDALRAQTLPLDQWELLLVDNASDQPLAEVLDLSWHPRALHILETAPGAQQARARGLRESVGELVVNVDDDNFLAPDYLAVALRLSRERPDLGAWGGYIQASFEGTPPAWLDRYMYHLAVITPRQAHWSSFVDDRSTPYGAGLCIRRSVVTAYLERLAAEDLTRYDRDDRRQGTSFVGAEDQFIVYTASSAGLSVGRFPELCMHHRIPARRYDPDYFLKLVRGNSHGALLVRIYHGNCTRHRTFLAWPVCKYLCVQVLYHGMRRRIESAMARGEYDALQEIRRRRTRAPKRLPASAVGLGVPTTDQPNP